MASSSEPSVFIELFKLETVIKTHSISVPTQSCLNSHLFTDTNKFLHRGRWSRTTISRRTRNRSIGASEGNYLSEVRSSNDKKSLSFATWNSLASSTTKRTFWKFNSGLWKGLYATYTKLYPMFKPGKVLQERMWPLSKFTVELIEVSSALPTAFSIVGTLHTKSVYPTWIAAAAAAVVIPFSYTYIHEYVLCHYPNSEVPSSRKLIPCSAQHLRMEHSWPCAWLTAPVNDRTTRIAALRHIVLFCSRRKEVNAIFVSLMSHYWF